MISKAIYRALHNAKQKKWGKTFWAFDIHETIVKPNWSTEKISTEFYPFAKEALQLISQRTDVTSILYTCTHPKELEKYLIFFRQNGIHFDYVNENPEVVSKNYGYFEKKPYFNVLFEDKAGFDAENDWKEVLKIINKNQEICSV
ncbi:hypothetical protein MATR_34910 [Marivirga tractuosa]|uniref:Uncharacterized protein n=1 Tax=Marivirga tractuosa (strain ATCC 23168 / DSM 4126 / NBRC 15989 / NCIMB 1408 / VKM B-1430 / H-43) TaxID=643867 RepID=E4TQE0_MARTH|nr:hypothetical protein [Marivirga tractuosa]ADR22663.1 hypothetical protein Ftrac_2685 [Marivirga tractuosa DSM 4126]BDD16666.1 hypothetical protein MATR_34910 [Marivirga tractuosa]